MRDPKRQAFLDDLVAVYVKHHLCVYSHEFVEIQELGFELDQASHLVVTDEGELLFLDEAPEDAVASSHIPNPTAHGRLAAAARVDAIRAEQTPPRATAHIECGWCGEGDIDPYVQQPSWCCPSCGKDGYIAAAIKANKEETSDA